MIYELNTEWMLAWNILLQLQTREFFTIVYNINKSLNVTDIVISIANYS